MCSVVCVCVYVCHRRALEGGRQEYVYSVVYTHTLTHVYCVVYSCSYTLTHVYRVVYTYTLTHVYHVA